MFGFRINIRSVRLLRVLWLGYWLTMAVVMHYPVPERLRFRVGQGDKLIHAMGYFLLTLLGGRVLLAAAVRPTTRRLLAWAMVYTAYAALDEALQPFSGRTASVHDWLADTLGIVLATCILATQSTRATDGEQS